MSTKEIQEILNLSRDKKLELVQILWDDISKESQFSDLSQSQIDELERRLKRIDDGTATFKSWDDVKKKYQTVL